MRKKKRRRWIQRCINTEPSLLTPMTGLEVTMIALLLLSLVAHSASVPLPSGDEDSWLLAEVIPDPDTFQASSGPHTTPHNVAAVLFQYAEVPPPVLWPPSWSPRKTEDLRHLSDQDQRDAAILQTQGDQICKVVIYSVNGEGLLL